MRIQNDDDVIGTWGRNEVPKQTIYIFSAREREREREREKSLSSVFVEWNNKNVLLNCS